MAALRFPVAPTSANVCGMNLVEPGTRVVIVAGDTEPELRCWRATPLTTDLLLGDDLEIAAPPTSARLPGRQVATVRAEVTGRSWRPGNHDDGSRWFLVEFETAGLAWNALARIDELGPE